MIHNCSQYALLLYYLGTVHIMILQGAQLCFPTRAADIEIELLVIEKKQINKKYK